MQPYIYLINLTTGQRELVWLRRRQVTLDFMGTSVRPVQDRQKYPLLLRFDGYNLTVTDRGLSQEVTIANAPLLLGQPRILLPNQELRIGDNHLLSWATTSERPTQRSSPTRNYGTALRMGYNSRSLFSSLLIHLRRGFGLNLERIVPVILALLFIGIFGLIGLLLWNYGKTVSARIETIPPSVSTPVSTATVTQTPAPNYPAVIPSTPFPPTVVRIDNLADIPPTATEIGAPPPGTTATPIPCVEHELGRGDWDVALDDLAVTFQPACVRPGEQFWHLIEAQWLDVEESNGFHHVFVDLLDENGQRVVQPPTQFVMQWTTGQCDRYIRWESDALGFGAHCPMYAAGGAYRVFVSGLPSDAIAGVGLGSIEQRDWRILTSYQFTFQRMAFVPNAE